MPYAIADPVSGQPISSGSYGAAVKAAINDLDARTGALETGQQAFIGRAHRETATGNVTTTETGVLRIDNIPVQSGKIYQIQTGPLNLDTDVNETIATARLRVAFSASIGTVATTSSTKIGTYRAVQESAVQSNVSTFNGFYVPAADGYISVLLSIVREGGTGNVVAFASASDPMDFIVQFGGNDPGNTGVVL